MSGMTYNPANTGPQLGFGPAPIEQNPMDAYGNPAGGGMPTQVAVGGPAQQPPGFQTSWEMAGYPTLEAWKESMGGTGSAQLGFGPAPMSTGSSPGGKGTTGMFNSINQTTGGLFGTPNPIAARELGTTNPQGPQIGFGMPAPTPTPRTASPKAQFRTGLAPVNRTAQPVSMNNRFLARRNRFF